jgi:Protein of unknown function (DUF938)
MQLTSDDARQHAPATGRNREAILTVLRDVLPPSGLVLEVASGTGEHAVFFARNLPGLTWQPSDPSPDARRSIAAWTAAEGLANVAPPLALDAPSPNWPIARAEALVCINMIHISPWAATLGLLQGAGRILAAGAPLVLYGPFVQPGRPLEASNRTFDRELRRRDPGWGLRDLGEVTALGEECGFVCKQVIEMPANNLSVVLRRT